MEKYGFVYIWRDRKHKRYYIGSHWGLETDKYICSSNWMRDAHKRRPQDFKRRILARGITSKQDLLLEEGKWLALIPKEEIGKRYYNLLTSQPGHWTAKDSTLPIKERMSKAQSGFRWYTDGVTCFKFRDGDEIPEGLVRGKSETSKAALREHYNLHPEAREKVGETVKKRLEDPVILESHVASLKKVDFKARGETLKRTYVAHPELSEAASLRASKRWAEGGFCRKA
jgi:hypothetical protein